MSETLGFLTESGLIPKKARAIDGVDKSSLTSLSSLISSTRQQLSDGSYEACRKKKRRRGGDGFFSSSSSSAAAAEDDGKKNAGVEERAKKDKESRVLEKDRSGAARLEALQRKAALYDRLRAGGGDGSGGGRDSDKVRQGGSSCRPEMPTDTYVVDFDQTGPSRSCKEEEEEEEVQPHHLKKRVDLLDQPSSKKKLSVRDKKRQKLREKQRMRQKIDSLLDDAAARAGHQAARLAGGAPSDGPPAQQFLDPMALLESESQTHR